jgi:hypothetical protein
MPYEAKADASGKKVLAIDKHGGQVHQVKMHLTC